MIRERADESTLDIAVGRNGTHLCSWGRCDSDLSLLGLQLGSSRLLGFLSSLLRQSLSNIVAVIFIHTLLDTDHTLWMV